MVLLDTHILLWWYCDSPKLPHDYNVYLDHAESTNEVIGVSIISLWEIAKKASLNRITLAMSLDNWFQELEDDPLIELIPLNGEIILESTRLGSHSPKDPGDQLIVSTARCKGLKIMTVDEQIRESNVVLVL